MVSRTLATSSCEVMKYSRTPMYGSSALQQMKGEIDEVS
jgi:hypothetical protein